MSLPLLSASNAWNVTEFASVSYEFTVFIIRVMNLMAARCSKASVNTAQFNFVQDATEGLQCNVQLHSFYSNK